MAVEISYSDFSVEVTRECSGIHSTMAMLILSVMASYFYLRTAWRQGLFIGVAVALTILKNAARIVTLARLGVYVDPGFLYGRLHSEGAANRRITLRLCGTGDCFRGLIAT